MFKIHMLRRNQPHNNLKHHSSDFIGMFGNISVHLMFGNGAEFQAQQLWRFSNLNLLVGPHCNNLTHHTFLWRQCPNVSQVQEHSLNANTANLRSRTHAQQSASLPSVDYSQLSVFHLESPSPVSSSCLPTSVSARVCHSQM